MNNKISAVEKMEQEIADEGIFLIDYPFESEKLKGITLVTKDKKVIGISNKIKSSSERLTILAEELSHYEINTGDISCNHKEEKKARLKSYDKLVGLKGIIDAYEHNCNNIYEMAEHLHITYEYLIECINAYADKYGIEKCYKNYKIHFKPYFEIEKLINN